MVSGKNSKNVSFIVRLEDINVEETPESTTYPEIANYSNSRVGSILQTNTTTGRY